jgi:glycine dehydrogenase subunit 1
LTNPFVQVTPPQLEEMLARVGAASIDGIFAGQIPREYEFDGNWNLPDALSEIELQREIPALAARNRSTRQLTSFLGGGVYDHYIPAAVGALANRSEFVTAYTPYQPEASQGTLQAFFEFQTMAARLFGMDVSNASLYDGASALGEALFLALSSKPERKKVLLPQALHPDYSALTCTYLKHFEVMLEVVPAAADGRTDLAELRKRAGEDTAAVVIQQPNYFGCLEEVHEVSRIAHEAGALLVAVADPIAAAIISPPGEYDADLAIGEGQPLGLRQWLGGESLGLFTCKKDFIRRVPGRLVGIARDRNDKRGYVLTLQTREQHIRREKATSNICTNHAHNALRATIYMSLLGPQGIGRVARMCVRNTQHLRSRIADRKPTAFAFSAAVFKEFVVRTRVPAEQARDELTDKGFLAGIPLGPRFGADFENALLVAVTERRTDVEIDAFARALEGYL